MVSTDADKIMPLPLPIPLQLSIVIPVYNNQRTLSELTRLIYNALHELIPGLEIVFVNDASTDQSLEVLGLIRAQYPWVRIIDLPVNVGQQMATLTGFTQAAGEYVAVMDADLQDDPACLPGLYQLLAEGADAGFVLRQGAYQPTTRMLTSRLFKSVMQLITGLHRQAGSYFITRQTVIQAVIKRPTRYPYATILVACHAKKIGYYPASRKNREGQSGYNAKGRMQAACRALYCALACRFC